MEVWLFNHWVTREVRKFLFIMSNDLRAMQLPYRTTCSGGLVAQSCPTLCDPVDCGPSGSSVLGLLQARIPEWVAIPFSGDLPTQGLKPGLPHCRQILCRLSPREVPGAEGMVMKERNRDCLSPGTLRRATCAPPVSGRLQSFCCWRSAGVWGDAVSCKA